MKKIFVAFLSLFIFSGCGIQDIKDFFAQTKQKTTETIDQAHGVYEDTKNTVNSTINKANETATDVENAYNEINEAKEAVNEVFE